ncbi:MAG: transporter [Rhodoglobus sp.]|nr:transporter [Rhodoglobus sp.]
MLESPAPRWAGRTLALVGVILAAANLRTAVAALSPIVAEVGRDIPLDSVGIGILGTLPPLCFAVFGLLTPLLRRRLHLEAILVAALAAITLGHLVRGIAPDYLALALGSTLTFAGMGVANVVLPPVVKKYFPDRVGALTSAYATVMAVSSLIPPLIAVPIADSAGWRVSLGLWAVFGVAALVPWVVLWVRERAAKAADDDLVVPQLPAVVVGRVWHSRLAWALALLFGMTSMNVYAAFAWLPQILRDVAGIGPVEAGALLALYAGVGIPLSLVLPVLTVRLRHIGPLVVVAAFAYTAGYGGLLVAPAAATWLWVGLAGVGSLLFPATLVLINLRTRTPGGAVALSGFTQGLGYLIGALGPVLVGVLHQVTGAWIAPLVFLLSTVAATVVTGMIVAKPRMLEDDWHPRTR